MAINTKRRATIKWVPEIDGGRKGPPAGLRYSTVARLDEQKNDWPQTAWSLVLDFSDSPHTRNEAQVSFLVEEGAPHELLSPGSKFDLFEGGKLVASGEIVSDSEG